MKPGLPRRQALAWAAASCSPGLAAADPLRVMWMFATGSQRTVWVHFVQRYARRTGRPEPQSRELEQSAYKAAFVTHLQQEPAAADVMFWFAGQRLTDLVGQGLLAPLDTLALAERWSEQFHPAALDAARVEGRLYGLPLSTYPWGFYYRRSLFRRLGLEAPTNWSEWLLLNERLRQAGVAPITLAAKDLWPLGAWFDYFNLRLHGKGFHLDLLAGRASWRDARVKAVFARWRELLLRGDVLAGANERDWRQALPYLSRGEAGMVLMGHFAVTQLPAEVRADLGFFRFPLLDPRQPAVEEAPLDVLVLPQRSRQKVQALDFLRYAARAEAQAELNQELGTLSPHRRAAISPDRLLTESAQMLAAAPATTQYFDRDASTAFSQPALGLLARFVSAPGDLEAVLDALEALRLRSFNP